jgi:hypothetical protein
LILDAAETVIGYFGFDRSVYGNKKYRTKKVEMAGRIETRKRE